MLFLICAIKLTAEGLVSGKYRRRRDEREKGDLNWHACGAVFALAISGHVSTERVHISQKTGEKGNPVTLMLVDPQVLDLDTEGPAGMVAMLYFSEDGRHVQVEYYSTIREKFLLKENQFSFELPVVGD